MWVATVCFRTSSISPWSCGRAWCGRTRYVSLTSAQTSVYAVVAVTHWTARRVCALVVLRAKFICTLWRRMGKWRFRCTFPYPHLCPRCRWVINLSPWPFYPRTKWSVPIELPVGWGSRADLCHLERRSLTFLFPGIDPRFLGSPTVARSVQTGISIWTNNNNNNNNTL